MRTLRGLAKARATQGDLAGAFEHARRALALVERQAPRGLDHGASLMILGIFHWFARGVAARPGAAARIALEMVQAVDPEAEDLANVLSNLGMVSSSRGDLAGAEEYYRRGLAAFARSGGAQDPLAVSRTLNNLATVAKARGDLESAVRYDREVLELRERLVPGSIDLAIPLLNLGDHLMGIGQLDEAERHLARALELQRRHIPNSGDIARTLLNIADAVGQRGDAVRAEALLDEALAIAVRTEPVERAGGHRRCACSASCAARAGSVADAERLLRRSATLLETLLPGTLEQARTCTPWDACCARRGAARPRSVRCAEPPPPSTGSSPCWAAPTRSARASASRGGTSTASWRTCCSSSGRKEEAFETAGAVARPGLPAPAAPPRRPADRRPFAGDRARAARAGLRLRSGAGEARGAPGRATTRTRVRRAAAPSGGACSSGAISSRSGWAAIAPRLAALEAVAGVADVRAALAGTAAALSYFVEERRRTRLCVVGARRTHRDPRPAGRRSGAARPRRPFPFPGGGAHAAADPAPAGRAALSTLIAPARGRCSTAPRACSSFPTGRCTGSRSRRWWTARRRAAGHFLVERMPIQMAASITAWIELRRLRRGGGGGFVAFADPEIPDARRVARARPLRPAAPAAPYSRLEAAAPGRAVRTGGRVVEGSAGQRAAAREAGRGARVLHFATHAFVDPVSPLDSALVLAPATDAVRPPRRRPAPGLGGRAGPASGRRPRGPGRLRDRRRERRWRTKG